MTSKERIYAAINNQPVDRIPFSFWRHFPKDEATSEGMARAVINFQEKFGFDLVKITPPASSMAEAWGSKYIYRNDEEGVRKGVRSCIFSPVNNFEDWRMIKKIDLADSILKREIDAVAIIRSAVDKSVPVVHTIPSPLTVIKMLNGKNWINDLRNHPEDIKIALANITETIKSFANLLLQKGADGIFFYTHAATYDFLTEDEYRIFGQKYDLEILNDVKKASDLLILHIHGLNIMFDLLKDYPVQVINWHDQLTSPSLSEAQKIFKRAVMGGTDEQKLSLAKTSTEIKKQVRDAIRQTKAKGLIIGPGCILPTDTPEKNIMAIKEVLSE